MDTILQYFNQIISWVMALLPDSPFQTITVSSDVQPYLSALNWLIPISFMLSTMELWLSAIAVYYIYQAVLRWARAIE